MPAASLNWTAIGALTGLGVIAALAGIAAFDGHVQSYAATRSRRWSPACLLPVVLAVES